MGVLFDEFDRGMTSHIKMHILDKARLYHKLSTLQGKEKLEIDSLS